jgi:hypothetical protein
MSNYKGDDRAEAHFTTDELINEMFLLKDKYVDFDITEYLENSAGDGRIIDRFDKPYIAYDINSLRDDIKEVNYLKEKIEYKKGRVCIMNPPFAIGLKFLYKALKECDYVIALLSQNSLLNIDYDKVWCDEIQLWRKVDFGTCKASVILVACRNNTR